MYYRELVTHRLVNKEWVATGREPKRPDTNSFIICCDYGAWSGYRTLRGCLDQNPDPQGIRPPDFYWIEER